MDITPAIISSFRLRYPVFSDLVKWPDDTVTISLCEGDAETGGKGWGAYEDDCQNFKQRGMFLYAAHWLTVTYPIGSAASGAMSGGSSFAVQSKSVGDESISFANGSINNGSMGDTWLASTNYGQQWMRLRRRAGMGAIAV